MDRLEAMSLFIETVERGSMSAAGRALGMPVATLSRKLSDLESHLGARLLTRSTRKLELTDAGAAFLAASRQILEQVQDAEREAAGEYLTPRGELVVTAPLAFGRQHVLPVVNAFLADYPDITVRLGMSDQHLDLIGEHVDLAVRIGVLPDAQLVARRLGHLRWAVVASPHLLERVGAPTIPEDLAQLPCVGTEYLRNAWRFRNPRASADHVVAVRQRLSLNTGEGAVDAAVAGIGFAQTLLYQAAPAIASGALRIVLADFEATPLPVSIVHSGQGRMPLKARRFLDFAAIRLVEQLADLDAIADAARSART